MLIFKIKIIWNQIKSSKAVSRYLNSYTIVFKDTIFVHFILNLKTFITDRNNLNLENDRLYLNVIIQK